MTGRPPSIECTPDRPCRRCRARYVAEQTLIAVLAGIAFTVTVAVLFHVSLAHLVEKLP